MEMQKKFKVDIWDEELEGKAVVTFSFIFPGFKSYILFDNFEAVTRSEGLKLLRAIKRNDRYTLNFIWEYDWGLSEISTDDGKTTFATAKSVAEGGTSAVESEAGITISNEEALPLIQKMIDTVTMWREE